MNFDVNKTVRDDKKYSVNIFLSGGQVLESLPMSGVKLKALYNNMYESVHGSHPDVHKQRYGDSFFVLRLADVIGIEYKEKDD